MAARGGNYNDNFTEASIAVDALQHGNQEAGLRQLQDIRTRIVTQREIKSLTWLLPEIDALLAHFAPPKLEDQDAMLAHPAGER